MPGGGAGREPKSSHLADVRVPCSHRNTRSLGLGGILTARHRPPQPRRPRALLLRVAPPAAPSPARRPRRPQEEPHSRTRPASYGGDLTTRVSGAATGRQSRPIASYPGKPGALCACY